MEQAQNRPAGSPPSWQWLVIGGAVLLSVAVAIIALRSSSASRAESSNEATPVLVPPREPALPPAVSVEAPAAEPAAAPGSSAGASALAPSDSSKPADSAELKKQPIRPVAPLPPQQRPKPQPSSGLTDFGGRR
jgi:hypothetical protein